MRIIENIRSECGFTLLESLFHLTVLVLFSAISLFIVIWSLDIQDIKQMKHDVNWELFVYDVQQYNQNSLSGELISSKMLQIEPANDEDNRVFFIEKPFEHIRKRSNKGGNEVMLPHVQDFQYVLHGNEIRMKVVTQDGKQRERMLVLPLRKE